MPAAPRPVATSLQPTLLATVILIVACFSLVLTPPAPAEAAGQYAVQFTVPSDKDEVWKFVEMLSERNYPAYMFTQDRGSGLVHYYAQMGTYASYDAAVQAAEALQQEVRVDYEIVYANSNKVAAKDAADQQTTPAPAPNPQPEPAAEPEPQPAEPAPQTVAEPATKPQPAAKPAPKPTPAPASAPAPAQAQAPKPTQTQTPKPAQDPPSGDPLVQETQPRRQAEHMPPPGSEPIGNTAFLVQLHSFSIKQNALDSARDYAKKGYSPVIILLYDDTHTPWYVLSLGHYPDRQTAAQAAQTFKALEGRAPTLNQVDAEFLETRVVPY